jgi:hypothetical protein
MSAGLKYSHRRSRYKANVIIAISVTHKIGSLDETVVIGYGKTTRRMNTGSVGKINQATIAQQPVDNALNALQGRVARP